MKILISNTSDSPLYQQIKDQIKDAILKEELVEGDPLPSIRAFANDLKVSVLTIRRVYEELEQEGFVTSQVGIGTFVSTSNLELLRDSKRRLVEQKMLDVIQTAKSLKISGVFFSTHITSDLDKIADMLIMISNGHIVFQEEKDFLLDNYRIVKGDAKLLTSDMRKLFLNVTETTFGFTGITKHAAEIQTVLSDAIVERPTIEDIMLANIERK